MKHSFQTSLVTFAAMLFMLCMPLAINAQNYSVNYKGTSIEKVIKDLREKTGKEFVFQKQVVANVAPITCTVSNAKLKDLLDAVIKNNAGLDYDVVNNSVVLKLPVAQVNRGPREINGMVVDENGEPLPGATITARNGSDKRESSACVTDINGHFKLTVPSGVSQIEVSYVGFETKIQRLGASNSYKIAMTSDANNLDEVLVVNNGIYARKAESFTGSAVAFNKEDLRAVGNTNVLQSLKNLDPSFHFQENLSIGSNPNATPDIALRGQSGFPDLKGEYQTNPNQPLFIVDGFETEITKVMDMDMNRIQSVTLLKDAAAKAIYGSKASNGVVIIETIKPEAGQLHVTYTGQMTVSMPDMSSYDLTNAKEKLEVERLGGLYNYKGYNGVTYWEDAYTQYRFDEEYNNLLKNVIQGYDTDWKSKPLRNAVGHKHTLYVEGGSNEFQYGIDLAYNDVAGVMKGSDRKTISGGLTFSYRTKKLLFRDNLEVLGNNAQNSPYGFFSEYTSMNPYYRPTDDNGNVIKSYSRYVSSWASNIVANPLWNSTIKTKDQSDYQQINNNFYVEWRATDAFKMIGRVGVMFQNNKSEVFHPSTHTDFISYTSEELIKRRGLFTYTDGSSSRISADINANYNKLFAEKHLVFFNAGWSINETKFNSATFKAEGFPNDRLDDIGFARQYAEDSAPVTSENTTRDAGLILAGNYSYDDKYLVDASFRLNGSSQFGSENRWGKFWSAGLGWNIHKEKFMESASWLDQLKLRASIGFTGSQNFSSYQSLATWTYYSSQFYNSDPGAYLLAMANPSLKWQKKLDKNIGLDFMAFNRRFTMRLDYYDATTDDLLTDVTIPSSTGFTSYKENLGKVQNRGWEVHVSGRVWENKKDRSYVNLYANLTHNTNKIKEISNSMKTYNDSQKASGSKTAVTIYEEGMSMSAIWAVPSMGIDPATGNEIFVKKDGTTTFDYSTEDLAICGDTESDVYGNFGLSASWKGFTMNLGFLYQWGGQLYNQTLVDKVENADLTKNVDRRVFTDRWQKPGDISRFKAITDQSTTYATQRFVENNNVLEFSSFNLSYDFDKFKAVKQLGFDRLRLSFDMNDICRWSSIKTERGTSYPYAKSFSFSIQAMF